MLKVFAAALMLSVAAPAFAAGPEDPVKSIMDLATALWADDPQADGQDYFDKQHLSTLYSKAFVAAYDEAAKHPLYDEASGPFGYDVITNGQDGCPLKEVKIEPGANNAGTTDVKVTFKQWTCYDDDPNKDSVSEVHFDVVTEDGKPVISDIHRMNDGKRDSLMTEMKDIAKNGGEQPEGTDDTQDQGQDQGQAPDPKKDPNTK